MKGQTAAYLDKARELLGQAETIFAAGLYEPSGRSAYLAGFHAAQAFIFETNDRTYKSHGGLHGEFARLVKDDPRVDDNNRAFLGRAYNLKTIADYETGPSAHVTPERAREAIDAGRRFVECVAGMLPTHQTPRTAATQPSRWTGEPSGETADPAQSDGPRQKP